MRLAAGGGFSLYVRRIAALGVAVSFAGAIGCATGASDRRAVADAEAVYIHAFGKYNGDCRATPVRKSPTDCWRLYRSLGSTRDAIQAAADAQDKFQTAKYQIQAMQKAVADLEKEVK